MINVKDGQTVSVGDIVVVSHEGRERLAQFESVYVNQLNVRFWDGQLATIPASEVKKSTGNQEQNWRKQEEKLDVTEELKRIEEKLRTQGQTITAVPLGEPVRVEPPRLEVAAPSVVEMPSWIDPAEGEPISNRAVEIAIEAEAYKNAPKPTQQRTKEEMKEFTGPKDQQPAQGMAEHPQSAFSEEERRRHSEEHKRQEEQQAKINEEK